MKNTKRALSPSVCAVLLAAVLLVSVNLCAVQISDRLNLRLDMTGNQLYTLSETTCEILAELDTPVQIRVFSAERDFLTLVAEVLRRYEQAGDSVTVVYTDPYENPTLVDEYLQRGLEIELGTVVVEGPYYARALPLEEMFTLDESGENVQSLNCEQQITSAILYAQGSSSPLVQFTAGHNEHITDGLTALFTGSNYVTGTVALSLADPDPGAALLVIASPTSDFTPEETAKLDRYMAAGGRLLLFAEPSSTAMPNLEAFLAEWGIGLTDTVVAETLQYTDSNPLSLVPLYASHPINQIFAANQLYLVMPSTRALEQLFVVQNGVQTQKLLYSTGRAYDSQTQNADGAPYALAITAEKTLDEGRARLVVLGSRGIYSDSLLASDQYANARFLAQAVNWCTETDSAVSIPAKNLSAMPILVTIRQVLLLALVLAVALPLALLGMGLRIWLRRRHS